MGLINNYIEYESNSGRNKTLSVEEHLNEISLYLKDITNNLISSICNDEKHVTHSKSDNKNQEVIKDLFNSLKNRYQNNLELIKGSNFFDYLHLLYYKYHRINPNLGGSYIDPPDWIRKQKSNNKSHQ